MQTLFMKKKIVSFILSMVVSGILIVLYRFFTGTLSKMDWIENMYFVLIALVVFVLLLLLDRKEKS